MDNDDPDESLSKKDNQWCENVVTEFHDSKAQKPTGVLDRDSGEFKHYFVWAGGAKKDKADPTEPGKYLNISNIYYLTPWCNCILYT